VPRFNRLELEHSSEPPGKPDGSLAPEKRDPSPPDNDPQWLRQADENRRQGYHENALRFYSRALELDKSLVPGWLGQVQMLIFLGEYPEAELWSRKALEIFRNNPELMAGRAQALCRMGDMTKAQPLCDAALAQPGEHAYRWIVRGEMMVSGQQDIDRYCFDKAIQIDADWLVPLEIALIYRHHKRPNKALQRVHQALEQASDVPYCWYIHGVCEEELGLDARARRSHKRCLDLSPGYVEAERRLARLKNEGGFLKRGLRRFLGKA
jgi:tetratricopeptide (TPR) repeat protein